MGPGDARKRKIKQPDRGITISTATSWPKLGISKQLQDRHSSYLVGARLLKGLQKAFKRPPKGFLNNLEEAL